MTEIFTPTPVDSGFGTYRPAQTQVFKDLKNKISHDFRGQKMKNSKDGPILYEPPKSEMKIEEYEQSLQPRVSLSKSVESLP